MKTIKQILALKGNDVYTIESSAFIVDAVKEMAEKKIGALVVLDDKKVSGIITDFPQQLLAFLRKRDPAPLRTSRNQKARSGGG
jgi:predicted transcriptional regulator